jgi:hypothetical protein
VQQYTEIGRKAWIGLCRTRLRLNMRQWKDDCTLDGDEALVTVHPAWQSGS